MDQKSWVQNNSDLLFIGVTVGRESWDVRGYGSGSTAGARQVWECGAGPVSAGPMGAGHAARGPLVCLGGWGSMVRSGGQVRRGGTIIQESKGCISMPSLVCCLPPCSMGARLRSTQAGAGFALARSPLLLLLLPFALGSDGAFLIAYLTNLDKQ